MKTRQQAQLGTSLGNKLASCALHFQHLRVLHMRHQSYEEGTYQRLRIDKPMLPGAVEPAAEAPVPLREEGGRTGIGEFRAEDVFQDTVFQGVPTSREN